MEECKKDPARLPRKWDLDPVSPDHPVAFSDFSGHTLLVNGKALEMAGITKMTPDPESGEMERDSDGEPTGIFKEIGAQTLVTTKIPLLTREEKKIAVENGSRASQCQWRDQLYRCSHRTGRRKFRLRRHERRVYRPLPGIAGRREFDGTGDSAAASGKLRWIDIRRPRNRP